VRQVLNWQCSHCGLHFTTWSKRERKFCSISCRSNSRKISQNEAWGKVSEKFWDRVDVRLPDDCWLWTGSKSHGYGNMRVGYETVRAHRIAWELHNREKLGDRMACHKCDVPLCCNPGHIYAGDILTNSRDMDDRGRRTGAALKGESSSGAILKEEDVRDIRHSTQLPEELEARYGISARQIKNIIKRRAWRHLV